MKITFKSYDDLKSFYTDLSKSDGTIIKTQQNAEFNNVINSDNYTGFCKDFDQFLQVIADKTFNVQDFKVVGSGLKKYFSIETSEIGADGGFNTNFPFESFHFAEDVIANVDYEGETLWACRSCGTVINPEKQKDYFDIKKTYAEVGVENAVCPLCFTKTFAVITE